VEAGARRARLRKVRQTGACCGVLIDFLTCLTCSSASLLVEVLFEQVDDLGLAERAREVDHPLVGRDLEVLGLRGGARMDDVLQLRRVDLLGDLVVILRQALERGALLRVGILSQDRERLLEVRHVTARLREMALDALL